jgi:hypothetical protein
MTARNGTKTGPGLKKREKAGSDPHLKDPGIFTVVGPLERSPVGPCMVFKGRI